MIIIFPLDVVKQCGRWPSVARIAVAFGSETAPSMSSGKMLDHSTPDLFVSSLCWNCSSFLYLNLDRILNNLSTCTFGLTSALLADLVVDLITPHLARLPHYNLL